MNTTKLDRLHALLAAAIELTNGRAEELGIAPGDPLIYEDEEYRTYLRIQFRTYDKIKETELLNLKETQAQ